MSKCIGCGVTLQNKTKKELGYTENLENKYCERCFKTIHYNKEEKINNIDNYKIIDKINKLGYFTCFITDFINLNNEVIDTYNKINNEKILIINKSDLIPKNIVFNNIVKNIKKVYNIDALLISAKTKYNLNIVNNLLIKKKNVILCGESSSGKSTLINKLCDIKLTTSKYSNTTLDFIKINNDDYVIYDSPGFSFKNDSNVDNVLVKTVLKKDDYVLKIDDTLLSMKANMTIYMNNNIYLSTKKGIINDYKEFKIKANSDILLNGCFIYVKDECIIRSNKDLVVRASLVGRIYERN